MLKMPDLFRNSHSNKTMPLVNNPTIENLIKTSHKEWISYSEITGITSSQFDNVYYAIRKQTYDFVEKPITLIFLGSSEECTSTLVSEFARIYSLPSHKYKINVSHFRRYSTLLENRNYLIKGFTKYDDNYYMVAD